MPSSLPILAAPLAGHLLKRLVTIAPQTAQVTVGLDVGSTSVKLVALGKGKRAGMRPIVGRALAPLNAGHATDPSGAITAAVQQLSMPLKQVSLSVSGQWVIMRIVTMPILKPTEFKQALHFEAQRYLPFSIDDVVLDGVVLGSLDATKHWVLIVACKKELIERRLDWVKQAGLEVGLIDVDALALANAFLANGDPAHREGTRAVINMGAQLTNLVIVQGEVPYLVRDIPWGGEKLLRSVAESLRVDPAVARTTLLQGTPTDALQQAMAAATESLSSELQLSFDYFENRFGQPPEEVFVTGGAAQYGGVLEALKRHGTQTFTPWAPTAGLPGQFAVAYGLALRAAA